MTTHTTLFLFGIGIGASAMFLCSLAVFFIQRRRFNLQIAGLLRAACGCFMTIAQETNDKDIVSRATRGLTDSVEVLRGRHRVDCAGFIILLAICADEECRVSAMNVLRSSISKEDLLSAIRSLTYYGEVLRKLRTAATGERGRENAEKLILFYLGLRTIGHLDAAITADERAELDERLPPPPARVQAVILT